MTRFYLGLCALALAAAASAQPYAASPWHIEATDIDPEQYFGITVANGMIGLVSSPQPMQVQDVVLNGAYDAYGRGRVPNILKGFNFANLYLEVDGRRLGAGDVRNFRQVLDMQHAELITTFDYADKVSVRHVARALRHLPYTAMIDVEIKAKAAAEIAVLSYIEAPEHLREVRQFYSVIDRPHVQVPLLTSVAASPSGQHTVAASCSYIFDDPHFGAQLIHEDWDYNRHWAKWRHALKAGEEHRFSIVGSTCASQHVPEPHNEVERLSIYAMLEGRERLVARHRAAWAELWRGDIVIEGDLRSQRAVRSALYHLYSFARAGTRLSLSPMGLSGLGYNGHVFWDTELWMYPPLLILQPDIAASLLDYRFDRIAAARENAFSHGYGGVMFPWESADSGQEVTPVWALTGPFQQHITACVGWAYWKYYQVTQDKAWLREQGYPMLAAVADFWASRVERQGPGQFHINNVIGANEWEENIDNNAFTNGMAKTVLHFASQAAEELGLSPDPDWALVAENIPILRFPDGTTRENATYAGGIIKQADANLLAYPLDLVREEADVLRDLRYYEPRLSPEGPAMAHSVLAVLYARLGDADKAFELFEKSYAPNEVPPFGVLAETAGGTNPYFATGAGGMLQVVLMGFGGLDIRDGGIVEGKGILPKGWQSLRIKGIGGSDRELIIRR